MSVSFGLFFSLVPVASLFWSICRSLWSFFKKKLYECACCWSLLIHICQVHLWNRSPSLVSFWCKSIPFCSYLVCWYRSLLWVSFDWHMSVLSVPFYVNQFFFVPILCIDTGLFCGSLLIEMGLFWCIWTLLMCLFVGLFCIDTGLFCGSLLIEIGLFCKSLVMYIGLFLKISCVLIKVSFCGSFLI